MGWVSRDGLTWTAATPPAGQHGYVGTLTAFHDRLLATSTSSPGGSSSLWSSSDGITWTATSDKGGFPDVQGAAATSHGLVMVGAQNEFGGALVVRSNDGTTWATASTSVPASGSFPQADTEAVAEFHHRLVAVGRASYGDTPQLAVWTSTNGDRWTQRPVGALLASETAIRGMAATSAAAVALAGPITLAKLPPTLVLSTDGATFQPVALAQPTFGQHLALTATVAFRDALWVIGRDDRGPAIWRWSHSGRAPTRFAFSVSADSVNASTPPPFQVQPANIGTVTQGQRVLVNLAFRATTTTPLALRFAGTTWTTMATQPGGRPGELTVYGTMCNGGYCQPSPLLLYLGLAASAYCNCNYGGENLPNSPWVVLATDNLAAGTYHADAAVDWSSLQQRFTFNPLGHAVIRLTIQVTQQ